MRKSAIKLCPETGQPCHYGGCRAQKGCVRKNPNMVRIVKRTKAMGEPSPSKAKQTRRRK